MPTHGEAKNNTRQIITEFRVPLIKITIATPTGSPKISANASGVVPQNIRRNLRVLNQEIERESILSIRSAPSLLGASNKLKELALRRQALFHQLWLYQNYSDITLFTDDLEANLNFFSKGSRSALFTAAGMVVVVTVIALAIIVLQPTDGSEGEREIPKKPLTSGPGEPQSQNATPRLRGSTLSEFVFIRYISRIINN